MLKDTKIKLKEKTEKHIEEYFKCKNSFEYHISKYILLELPGGDIYINPYDKQKELLQLVYQKHYVIVIKSRQIGISTIIQAYISWLVVFHENVVVGIVSKDGKESTDFARFIMGFIDKLPNWMQPKFTKRTERTFILKNGSKCYATPVDPKAPSKCLRGKSVTFLVLDEAAHTEKLDDAWTSMVPTLATNQKHAKMAGVPYGTIILSTPNKTTGVGKFFYSRYLKSIANDGIFKPFIIHWKMIQELAEDPDWYKMQCDLFDGDLRKIQQELELKFLPTEGSFFDEKTNVVLQDNPKDPIEVQKIFNGEIRIYEHPIDDKHYLIGVDTATENGDDKSAIVVVDYETMDQVWEYQAKCAITDFAKIVEVACATYPGTLIVENNTVASQLVEGLDRSNYHSMLYRGKLKGNGIRKAPTIVPGLPVNRHTRPLIIDSLYSYVTNYPTTIKSKSLALELIGLVTKKNNKVEADTGCLDDLALALSFCCYVRKFDPPLVMSTTNSKQLSDFGDILNLNDDISIDKMDNGHIMKRIKNNLDKNDENNLGFINVMDFYNDK